MTTVNLSTDRGSSRKSDWANDNTDASVTYAAVTGKAWRIEEVSFGFDVTPSGAALEFKLDGTTTHIKLPIGDTQPYCLALPSVYGQDDTAVIVTLTAGGAGTKGYLNVHGRSVKNGTP